MTKTSRSNGGKIELGIHDIDATDATLHCVAQLLIHRLDRDTRACLRSRILRMQAACVPWLVAVDECRWGPRSAGTVHTALAG